MKKALQLRKHSRRHKSTSTIRVPIYMDEAYSFMTPNGTRLANLAMVAWRKVNSKRAVVTQAIVRRNSGKRVRFISVIRHEDGTALQKVPTKFLPIQVVRKAHASLAM